MQVTLNLATRPFADAGPALKRLRIGIAVLAALCLLFLLGLHLFGSQAAAARAREHSLDGSIAHVEAERQSAQAFMQQPDNAKLLQQAEFLNQRFDEKSFSWTLAMEAMETVLPAGVQVTAIEPLRTKEGQITVDLRVLGPRDHTVDLVRNLEDSRRFLSPRIESESAENSSSPNQRQMVPVSASNRFEFEIFADYNPPTPEERAALNSKARKDAAAQTAVKPPKISPEPSRPRIHRAPSPSPAQHERPPYTGLSVKPSPTAKGGAR